MKKFVITVLGALLMAAPAAAQLGGAKVDVAKLRATIAKSDADVANPKNANKASAWIKRGETLVEVDGAAVSGLYVGMPRNMLALSMGDVTPSQEKIGEATFDVYTYDNVKVFVSNDVIDFFVATTVVDPQALDKACEAFDKAFQLDPKTAKKVSDGLGTIRIRSFENGNSQYSLRDYITAAKEFRRAYAVSTHPTMPSIDTLSLYYAGVSAAYGEDWEKAVEDLGKAIDMGYESTGDAYRLKFVALYNLDRRPESLETLKKGIVRFPGNEELIDVMLRYYAENDDDPTEIIPLVEDAIDKNPNNPLLYQGLARIQNKLGQNDEAIATMKKAVEIDPNDFLSNYFEGLFIVEKGDAMAVELSRQTFTSRAASQEALGAVNDVFRSAIAPLERAFAIMPDEIATVELLKNLTFRLRDEEGMQAKNTKYNDLFNTMNN